MDKLAQRVEALERVLPPASRLVVVRVLVDPDHRNAPLDRAEVAGRVLRRCDDEDEARFLERAKIAALDAEPTASVVRVIAYATTTNLDEVPHDQP